MIKSEDSLSCYNTSYSVHCKTRSCKRVSFRLFVWFKVRNALRGGGGPPGRASANEGRKDHNPLYHHQHHHHIRCHRHHPLERAACANESLMDHKHSACKSRPSHLTSPSSSFAISEISALSLLVHPTREKEEIAASLCY